MPDTHARFYMTISKHMVQRIRRQAIRDTDTGHCEDGNAEPENRTDGFFFFGIPLTYEARVTMLAGADANDQAEGFLKDDLVGFTLHQELKYLTEAAPLRNLSNPEHREGVGWELEHVQKVQMKRD